MVSAKDTGSSELKYTEHKLLSLEEEYPDRFIWYKNPLTHEEIAELHDKAGVYIQPSLYEPFGSTVLEALAKGKAVVVTDVGGMPEMIDKAGIVVKPNVKSIVPKVLKLLKDTRLRKKYSKLAAERAKDFEWRKIANQYLNLYHEIIHERKKRKIEAENIAKKSK
jgi:glycosyltransferase involved in cell wall biosynthesis